MPPGTPQASGSLICQPQAPKGGELRLPALGGFDTLNPFTLKGDKEAGVTELLFDTLAEKSLDEPFSMYGLLADDIRLAPNGLSVTFHLNPKARFSNGDPVLARDVVSSFVTLTQDKAAHPRFRFRDGIRGALRWMSGPYALTSRKKTPNCT